MRFHTAIIIEDLAADRQLATLPLERAGWRVLPARNSAEGTTQIAATLEASEGDGMVIVTDLHLPNDPAAPPGGARRVAGAYLALQLRSRMSRGELPRVSIVALTALSEREIHMTALAFGCDAVLTKPATPDLAARIEQAVEAAQREDAEVVGADALLRLMRLHLADTISALREEPAAVLSEQDIKQALLAYRRQGLMGLGASVLAQTLFPDAFTPLHRGEQCYQRLLECLHEIRQLGAAESVALLQKELVEATSPGEVASELALSRSEYYRRRSEAISVLLDLLSA